MAMHNFSVSAASSVSRNYSIDVGRIIACFGVIVIHVHATTSAAESLGRFFLYFCVPYFYVAALAFFAGSLNAGIDTKKVLIKLAKRIGIPLVLWSLIYAGLIFVKSRITHHEFGLNLVRVVLYGESAEHIYYLPELLCMQALMLGAYLLIVTNRRSIGLVLCLGALAYLLWGNLYGYYGVTATKSIVVYILMAFFAGSQTKSISPDKRYLLAGIVLTTYAVVSSYIVFPNLLVSYLSSLPISGIGLFLIALGIPNLRIPTWLESVSLMTYGVYLSHVLFLEAIEFSLGRLHFAIYYNVICKLTLAFIVFCICIVFIVIVRRNNFAKKLLLGEY